MKAPRELSPCFRAENHQGGCPCIGLGTGVRNDSNGGGRRDDWRTATRVHRMRKVTVSDDDPVSVVARGGHRGILQGEDRMRRAALTVRFLDRYGPGLAVGAQAKRPHLTVDADQAGNDAEAA
jgi:hypothetical protein